MRVWVRESKRKLVVDFLAFFKQKQKQKQVLETRTGGGDSREGYHTVRTHHANTLRRETAHCDFAERRESLCRKVLHTKRPK